MSKKWLLIIIATLEPHAELKLKLLWQNVLNAYMQTNKQTNKSLELDPENKICMEM